MLIEWDQLWFFSRSRLGLLKGPLSLETSAGVLAGQHDMIKLALCNHRVSYVLCDQSLNRMFPVVCCIVTLLIWHLRISKHAKEEADMSLWEVGFKLQSVTSITGWKRRLLKGMHTQKVGSLVVFFGAS